MEDTITFIPFSRLLIIFIPVSLVVLILNYWLLDWKNSLQAIGRMLIQLTIIGYLLSYIFSSEDSIFILFILIIMVLISSWIALGVTPENRFSLLFSHINRFINNIADPKIKGEVASLVENHIVKAKEDE